jgi:hypothetical protein
MKSGITCFVLQHQLTQKPQLFRFLEESKLIRQIFIVNSHGDAGNQSFESLEVENPFGSKAFQLYSKRAGENYTLLITRDADIRFGPYAPERMLQIAEDTMAGLIYSDYCDMRNTESVKHPVNDYQEGSIRDDFDFGPALLFPTIYLDEAFPENSAPLEFGAFYHLRLHISRKAPILRIQEYLYTVDETDKRKSGEKIFDYVNPKNRAVQIEMEQIASAHLKCIGAYLQPRFREVSFRTSRTSCTATVVIPVKNRERTIEDAIVSVLAQETDFLFNLIIINNHSTDRTSELINKYAKQDHRLIHLVPERTDLAIGGCWNEGIHHPQCGDFIIQLDSDDVYSDPFTLRKIIEAFYMQKCAMIIGSYRMANFNLEEIPPGVIDHREWTPENGRNNALRINGLGAPRAFYSPILREIKLPNVSYGEDYAVVLALSRHYQIGRIYEPIYLCRRWDDNTDADLNISRTNEHNMYKDRIRTMEILARRQYNKNVENL